MYSLLIKKDKKENMQIQNKYENTASFCFILNIRHFLLLF